MSITGHLPSAFLPAPWCDLRAYLYPLHQSSWRIRLFLPGQHRLCEPLHYFIRDCGNGVLYERICGFSTINGTAAAFLQYRLPVFAAKVDHTEVHTVCLDLIFTALKDALDDRLRRYPYEPCLINKKCRVPLAIPLIVSRKVIGIRGPFALILRTGPFTQEFALLAINTYKGLCCRPYRYFLMHIFLIYL